MRGRQETGSDSGGFGGYGGVQNSLPRLFGVSQGFQAEVWLNGSHYHADVQLAGAASWTERCHWLRHTSLRLSER